MRWFGSGYLIYQSVLEPLTGANQSCKVIDICVWTKFEPAAALSWLCGSEPLVRSFTCPLDGPAVFLMSSLIEFSIEKSCSLRFISLSMVLEPLTQTNGFLFLSVEPLTQTNKCQFLLLFALSWHDALSLLC